MKGAAGDKNPAFKHGHTANDKFSPEYYSWTSMRTRCTNAKVASFKHYGGRGITVCARWSGAEGFQNFLADMGPRPDGCSLDRVDVDGGYSPENCRWADVTTQARNSKQVVWVELNGVRKRLVEWCQELGVSINTVRDRVKFYGLCYEDALTTPKAAPFKKLK